jgi:hypothetical protein
MSLAVVLPKGFIEGRIVYMVLSQGENWFRDGKECRASGDVDRIADVKAKMETENKTLAEV